MAKSKKVACRVCGYEGNILARHISSKHGLSVEEYLDKYPDAKVVSAAGKRMIDKRRREQLAKEAKTVTRPTKKYSIRETFGIDLDYEVELDAQGRAVLGSDGSPVYKKDKDGKPIPIDMTVEGFADKPEDAPLIDLNYVFPKDQTMEFLIGMHCHDRILLTGETGTGKTSLVEQIGTRLGYNVVKISFDGGVTRDDLVGCWQHRSGHGTVFQEGILTRAMRLPGTIILLDEWDTINSDCSFVLQRPLQKDDGNLQLMETGGDLVPLHPQSVIAATANTIGMGDDSGLYSQGTSIQNYAQLNRFTATLKMKYLPVEVEEEILRRKFQQNGKQVLNENEIKAFVRTINLVRDGYVKGEVAVPLSTRDLINWAEKYLMMGKAKPAARLCFLNRMPQESAMAVEGMIQRTCEKF